MFNVMLLTKAADYISSLINRDEEEGQGLVEYALILVLISVVAIVIMTQLGGSVTDVFQDVDDGLNQQP